MEFTRERARKDVPAHVVRKIDGAVQMYLVIQPTVAFAASGTITISLRSGATTAAADLIQ